MMNPRLSRKWNLPSYVLPSIMIALGLTFPSTLSVRSFSNNIPLRSNMNHISRETGSLTGGHRSFLQTSVVNRLLMSERWKRLFSTTSDENCPFNGETKTKDDETRILLKNNEQLYNDTSEYVTNDLSSHQISKSSQSSPLQGLTPGSNGFYIVKAYKTNHSSFDMNFLKTLVDKDEFERLDLTAYNISVPIALMMLDPVEYPSRSRARKACRKANIMIHRGPLEMDTGTGKESIFDAEKSMRARVGDRIYPGDVIAKQVRIADGYVPVLNHKKPPFDLPVLFEDDHFAIVNKPAGVVVYAQRKGGHGIMTVRAALPFAVQPSKIGTYSTLRRPQPVHRLDKPTSGLLIVAKTKPAMVHLSHQFRDRKVKKTYVAILNGIPPEPMETVITGEEAYQLGFDVEYNADGRWQIIDHPLEGKSAVTIWRSLIYSKSLKALDNHVTLVELKPKTGRYHQLRRHMAWICERPIVGDSEYDGGGPAMSLRERGLFLCSNRVTLEHPFYNDLGRDGESIMQQLSPDEKKFLWLSADGKVMVTASIDAPNKFKSFMENEDSRYRRLFSE